MRKVLPSVVVIALLAPILASLCQWQCRFMFIPESPLTLEILAPGAHQMDCCAVREVVLKKPLPELTSKYAPATLLDPVPNAHPAILDGYQISNESPPGPIVLPAFLSSPSILRI